MVCDCGGCKCSRGALYLVVVEVRESAARLLLRSRFTSMTKRANFVTTCLNKFNLMSWTEKLPAMSWPERGLGKDDQLLVCRGAIQSHCYWEAA
jgi:hypothetical protein